MADEGTLVVLKLFLENRGYEVQTWGFGRNVGFSTKHASALEQKIRYMHYKSGRRVSLVGWSLGGMYAMYGAHVATECVRSVITLGSPVSLDAGGSQSPPLVKALYRLIAHPMGTRRTWRSRAPSTCAGRRNCRCRSLPLLGGRRRRAAAGGDHRRQPGAAREHPGGGQPPRVGFNPLVLWIVADRLAQREGRWRRFSPPPGLFARIYRLTSRFAPA